MNINTQELEIQCKRKSKHNINIQHNIKCCNVTPIMLGVKNCTLFDSQREEKKQRKQTLCEKAQGLLSPFFSMFLSITEDHKWLEKDQMIRIYTLLTMHHLKQ